MSKTGIVFSIIGGVILMIALSFAFGFLDVLQIKTVGKAKENAKREVFEQTQSFVEGKRQEALKLFQEYNECIDEDCKAAIEFYVRQGFANFDEEKYLTGKLQNFVAECKY